MASISNGVSDRELRETYQLLSKDRLIDLLIEKHRKLWQIEEKKSNQNFCPNCGKQNWDRIDGSKLKRCVECNTIW